MSQDLISNDMTDLYMRRDYVVEESRVVDNIYKINDKYKEELAKPNPDRDKLLKLFNQQLMEGLKLQMFS